MASDIIARALAIKANKTLPAISSADAGKLATVDSNGKWAAANLTVGQGEVAVDSTLLVTGAAADAKVTGDKVAELKSALKNAERGLISLKAQTPATLGMFEKIIFSTDIGFAPQGIVVNGNIAYVCNGATPPLNVIAEINLSDGSYETHTISELEYGGNSLALDTANNLLYVAEHHDGGVVHIIDVSNWSYVGKKTMPLPVDTPNGNWNIVFDPIEQCFYNYAITRIYKLNSNFELVDTIYLNLDQNKYPTAKPGVTQGFGYDGTYFYVPRSEVYDVNGNSFTFVFDKNGEIVKYYRGLHHEIENYYYDYMTGKSYACYAYSATGYITEFVEDSGWISIADYVSDNYQSKTTPTKIDLENTTAQFRVKNGSVYFKGAIKAVNNGGTLCYLDGRIAPARDMSAFVFVTEGSSFASTAEVIKVNFSALTYWSPDFTYLFVPVTNAPAKNGYWWIDGISLPLYRD